MNLMVIQTFYSSAEIFMRLVFFVRQRNISCVPFEVHPCHYFFSSEFYLAPSSLIERAIWRQPFQYVCRFLYSVLTCRISLVQGSLTPGLWPTTGLWPIHNWAVAHRWLAGAHVQLNLHEWGPGGHLLTYASAHHLHKLCTCELTHDSWGPIVFSPIQPGRQAKKIKDHCSRQFLNHVCL